MDISRAFIEPTTDNVPLSVLEAQIVDPVVVVHASALTRDVGPRRLNRFFLTIR